jgi:hypothetical protein
MKKMLLIGSLSLSLLALALPQPSSAAIVLSIGIAPPPLPVYEQPLCPGEGYIWTPGYWAYDDEGGYFWVPGTWVLAPEPGLLWTPGYWGWGDTAFIFHEGYWGPQVGFYGGINYGFGYVGVGYEGGYWRNGAFFYNRSVNHITNITNVYNKTIVVNNQFRNVSYNGGQGGITVRASAAEEAAARERHVPPIGAQTEHVQAASRNRELFEATNHGRPPVAATARPADFSGHDVVKAKSADPSYRPPTERSASPGPNHAAAEAPRNANPVHPHDLQPIQRATPNTGNPKQDQKYQQQQDQLRARQEQEQQKLQQKQDQEHQKLAQHKASDAQTQRVEQKHQQQTQQLAQKHSQQQQQFQAKLPKQKR